MTKYRFLYKEFLLKILVFTVFMLALMFLLIGTKTLGNTFDQGVLPFINNDFFVLQLAMPIFLFDLFYFNKSETIRETRFFIFVLLERLVIVFIISTAIRFLSCSIYSLIIYHNMNFMKFLGRLILCDIGTILVVNTLSNLILNRYVELFFSLLVSIVLFFFKIFNFSVFVLNDDKYLAVSWTYYLGIGIFAVLLIISRLVGKEYVRD